MRNTSKGSEIGEAVAVTAGLAVFALLVHTHGVPSALAAGSFLAAAVLLVRAVVRAPSPLQLFGLAPVPRATTVFIAAGLGVGFIAALLYRDRLGAALLPQTLTGFALVAGLIGGVEEILYRGYVQGRLQGLGAFGAIAGAAALHAAYKSALFALPPEGVATLPLFIAAWTFVGGLLFGVLRQLSGNVLAPLAAHVCFDLLVYGNLAQAPWWVWA
jgi:membrane protease YdiL (CAAX protease family)